MSSQFAAKACVRPLLWGMFACGFIWLSLPPISFAWCPMTTGQGLVPNASNEPCPTEGEVLHWERQCISFAIDERGAEGLTPAELLPAIEQSFLVWTSLTCNGSGPGIQIGALGERSRCQSGEICGNGNVNTIAFLADWNASSGVNEVFAQTVTSADTSSGEILDVDILVNDESRNYADCSNPTRCNGGETDLQSVMTHEIGHFFGLGHASEFETTPSVTRAATMFDAMDPGDTNKRSLEQDDIDGYCSIYEDVFSQSVECQPADFTPLNGLRLDCEAEACEAFGGGCGCETAGIKRNAMPWPWLLSLSFVALILARRRFRMR